MAKQQILTAIDLGTEKTVALIASLGMDDLHELQVLGVSVLPSSGMKKSQIVDLEAVITTLSKALDAAERMAGTEARQALVSITGAHIDSMNSKGVVAVAAPSQEISSEDIARVIEAARAISLPPSKRVVHVIPQDFSVDTQTGIKDPLGMTGIRLESEAHIITATNTALKNLEKSINDVGLNVSAFVFSGLAAATAVLTETEKELGVVSVDIGAGTSSLCCYVDGSLQHSATIPIGARHITQDIALGCRISLEAAEKVKLALSKDPLQSIVPKAGESKESLRKRKKLANELNLEKLGIQEGVETLSKKTVIEAIMVPRIKEIFSLLMEELRKKKLTGQIPAGFVISGGGAETVALTEIGKRSTQLPVRIAAPKKINGLTSDLCHSEFSTVLGMLLYAKKHSQELFTTERQFSLPISFSFKPSGKILKKAQSLFTSLLP